MASKTGSVAEKPIIGSGVPEVSANPTRRPNEEEEGVEGIQVANRRRMEGVFEVRLSCKEGRKPMRALDILSHLDWTKAKK